MSAEWYVLNDTDLVGPLTQLEANSMQDTLNEKRNGCDAIVIHESMMEAIMRAFEVVRLIEAENGYYRHLIQGAHPPHGGTR